MDKSAPLVSIITSCYNHEKYLDDFFKGLLSQTYSNLQIIFIDDGSTDRSWDKAMEYEPKLKKAFPSVILERHSNQGVHKELAIAQSKVTGEYICILESDDYYRPEKIEKNINFLLDNPDCGFVHSDADFIENGQIEPSHWKGKLGAEPMPQGDVFLELLRRDNFVLTCSMCCRTEIFNRFIDYEDYYRRGYRRITDYAMFLDLARHTRFGYLPESLVFYRVVKNSLSHPENPDELLKCYREFYRMKLDYVKASPLSNESVRLVEYPLKIKEFEWGYRFGNAGVCEPALRWLAQYEPACFNKLAYSIRAWSTRRRWLWKWIYALDKLEIFYHLSRFVPFRAARNNA